MDCLVPRLAPEHLAEALLVARRIDDRDARLLASAGVAARLDDETVSRLFLEAESFVDPRHRSLALGELAARLGPAQRARAIERAHELERWEAPAFTGLLKAADAKTKTALVDALVARAAAEDPMFGDEGPSWILGVLGAGGVPEAVAELADSLLAADRPERSAGERAGIIQAALPHVNESKRRAWIDELLREDSVSPPEIAEWLDAARWAEMVERVAQIEDPRTRGLTAARLVSSAPAELEGAFAREAMLSLKHLTPTKHMSVSEQAEQICALLAGHVSPQLGHQAVAEAQDATNRREAIVALCRKLPYEDWPRIVEAAETLNHGDRARACLAFAENAPGDHSVEFAEKALGSALAAETSLLFDNVLERVCDALVELAPERAEEFARTLLGTTLELPRPELLAKVYAARSLLVKIGDALPRSIEAAIHDVGRWWA